MLGSIVFGRKYDISERLEVWIPLFTKSEYEDTHGGFHGDGESIDKIYFNSFQERILLWQINKNRNWKALPYNVEFYEEIIDRSYRLNIDIPKIENGYCFFKDRNSKAVNIYDEKEIFSNNRNSFNFSFAVYDIDNNVLYIYEEDT